MKLRLTLLSSALVLAACSGVGEGSKLEKLRFVASLNDARVALTTEKVFECFPQGLNLVGEFTNGALGDFTRRGAVYTSSNPAVVRVSNGEIPVPGRPGETYNAGALIPVAPGGPATVTAEFAGLKTSIEVTVGTPGPITVTAQSSPDGYVAPDSTLDLTAMTTFDGQPVNVSRSGEWTFDVPNDFVATINPATGRVTGKGPGTSMTARINLSACRGSPLLDNAKTSITVATIDHLELQREFPGQPVIFSPGPPLSPTTDAIKTFAVFAGGQRQDLTFQATLALTPADALTFRFGNGNLLMPLQEGPSVTVTGSFTSVGTAFTTGPSEPIRAKSATLKSVKIKDSDVNPTINGFGTYQFHVIGNYEDATGAPVSQDITRHVIWSSSNASAVSISNTYGLTMSYGFATSLKNEAGCVTITADPGVTGVAAATTLLAINSSTQTTAQPCTPQ